MPSEFIVTLNENETTSSVDENEVIIGQTPLDPRSTQRCWACFVKFRDDDSNDDTESHYYTQHEHPTLGIVVCSVCHDGAECVERRMLDSLDSKPADDDDTEVYCSFCSLPSSELDPPHPPLADTQSNDLLLCDSCPRAFCQKCVCVALGGTCQDLTAVRKTAESDGEWNCCLCKPTDFLGRLKEGYAALLKEEEDGSGGSKAEEGEDSRIAKLIDELHGAESKYTQAQHNLEDGPMNQKRQEIEAEFLKEAQNRDDLTELVEEERERYRNLWIQNSERLQETIGKLLNELEDSGVNAADVYKFWEEEEGKMEDVVPGWKREADLALDARDTSEGFSKGEFRGATGYKAQDTRIYKLEPEDLTPSNLKEIEDINTTHGAITQMARLRTHQEKSNQWGSKTGTTAEDIEMFEKKCTKFEEITLGDKIDLKALERNYIKDKDDEVRVKHEGATMAVRRKDGTGPRVVKRTTSVRSTKIQDDKESISAQLSGYSKEYKPSITVAPKSSSDAPKAKKRAQLIQNSSSLSAHMFPSMKSMLIGSDTPYIDSDIVFPVKNCSAKVSVCKPLASLLKEHQIEGVKFCWERLCENLFEESSTSDGDVRGAILAHSMGVGKSIQTIALLHTLLTNPNLVRRGTNISGNHSNRLVQRVLLIAPVNTLTNWEAEFKKWIGERELPFIRYLPFEQGLTKGQKVQLIREWHKYGGVLCCSSGIYAGTVKITDEKSDSKNRREKISEEDRAMLYEAMVKPGPDVVVLDEAHTMLKNSNTSMSKALTNLHTSMRLSLTGTPMQNNLREYYSMASWTKPGCLGLEARFINKYDKPIMAGMAADCTPYEATKQEELSSELHQHLSSFVHRCSSDVLKKSLPFLQECIIHIRQSKPQTKLYREYNKFKRANNVTFWDQYHALAPVSNHPACLPFFRLKLSRTDSPSGEILDIKKVAAPDECAWYCDICKTAKFATFEEAEEHEANCQDFPLSNRDNESKDWWKSFHDNVMRSGLNINAIEHGGKIVVLLQILAHCDAIGDKVVVFSKCLKTLDFIEEVLQSPTWNGFTPFLPNGCSTSIGGWKRNKDYSRIDGQVNASTRGELINSFNTVEESKVFLVSIQAGGLGVNLIGANRVVLFDAHWNPAITDQAIHRCYRYGQTKPVFCYQLLAEGSMEEKIYSRAKTKTSLSGLVLDEKNIDRLYTRRELDLMTENDTWVSCEACNKWRMLPPDVPDDEVANLPEKWYCKDNIHDPDRSFCDAPVESSYWYAHYWENRMKESQEGLTPFVALKGNDQFEEVAERDVVLHSLLSRCEGSSTTNSKQTTNTWISKYAFSKETVLDAEAKKDKTTKSKAEASPKKKKQVTLPTRSSPRKTAVSPNKKANMHSVPEEETKKETAIPSSQPTASPSIGHKSSSSQQGVTPELVRLKENSVNHTAASFTSSPEEQICSPIKSGQKRKSPQQPPETNKSPKSTQTSKIPETIDLLDSDSDNE